MGPHDAERLRSERILIVGGSGWIGQAVQQELRILHCDFICLNSHASDGSFGYADLQAFAPSTVIFLAGITPDRGPSLGLEAYDDAVNRVTDTLDRILCLPGLRNVCYASSGIVTLIEEPEPNPFRAIYRQAKTREEHIILASQAHTEPLIARVFSLSGPYVRRPEHFALYDFIRQSLTGTIKVTSKKLVYRSYASVIDLARVLVSSLAAGKGGSHSTGGSPIELMELAAAVARLARDEVKVLVPGQREVTDYYCGDDADWQSWCRELGVLPRALEVQIADSAEWLERDLSSFRSAR